jgi:hypothetical protein
MGPGGTGLGGFELLGLVCLVYVAIASAQTPAPTTTPTQVGDVFMRRDQQAIYTGASLLRERVKGFRWGGKAPDRRVLDMDPSLRLPNH